MLFNIARCANDYAFGWIKRLPAIKEESITDWMLDYFCQKSPNIRYYQFTRYEEGHFSGADWDWWFLLRKGCYKLRIQAKKVQRGKDHYRALAHSNNEGYQIDMLHDTSAKYNFYPLYSIYGLTENVERCKPIGRSIALSICSAEEIFNLVFCRPRHNINSADILSLTIPLECFFGCPLMAEFSVNGPGLLFDRYFKIPPRGIGGEVSKADLRGFESETPSIVRSLFEMKEINDNTRGILREYMSMFAGSNGVSVVEIEA